MSISLFFFFNNVFQNMCDFPQQIHVERVLTATLRGSKVNRQILDSLDILLGKLVPFLELKCIPPIMYLNKVRNLFKKYMV